MSIVTQSDRQGARAVSAAVRKRIQEANEPPKTTHKTDGAVVPFPSARQSFVKRELQSVRDYDQVTAYKWLSGVVRRHRLALTKLGIAPDLIERNVAELSNALGLEAGQ